VLWNNPPGYPRFAMKLERFLIIYIYTYIIYIYINNHFFFVRPEPRLSEVWIWPGTQDRERDRPWLLLGMPK
jgi:hypothetical protein